MTDNNCPRIVPCNLRLVLGAGFTKYGMQTQLTPGFHGIVPLLRRSFFDFLPDQSLRCMSRWNCKRETTVLHYRIKDLLQQLERVLMRGAACAEPYADDDSLLDPRSILFPHQPILQKIVKSFGGVYVAADIQLNPAAATLRARTSYLPVYVYSV